MGAPARASFLTEQGHRSSTLAIRGSFSRAGEHMELRGAAGTVWSAAADEGLELGDGSVESVRLENAEIVVE